MVFLQAARALQRLHSGVGETESTRRVHGDVKLDNFMLTPHGLVKLLDYGFMLDISTPRRNGIEKMPHYCSPKVKSYTPILQSYYTIPCISTAYQSLSVILLCGACQ